MTNHLEIGDFACYNIFVVHRRNIMKVLLFTHIADIDGMGPAIFSKIAFGENNVDVVYCNSFDLADNIEKKMSDVGDYDMVYVTDLSPDDKTLDLVENNADLRDKIKVFDHHPIAFSGDIQDYPYLQIEEISESGKIHSATSLFCDYLMNNKLIMNRFIFSFFANLTRLYDTWEWKCYYGKEQPLAEDLNILFFRYGRDKYVQNMVDKFNNGKGVFSEEEKEYIKNYREKREIDRKKYIDSINKKNIDGHKVGVIADMSDEYKNDIPQVLRDKYTDFDYLAMFIVDRGTISLRNIKQGFDVSDIAKKLGGGGHKFAASVPATEDNLELFAILNDVNGKKC